MRKQRASHDDFVRLLRDIEQHVSREELDALIERTVAEIRQVCSGKRAAVSWSGGKDSLAVAHCAALAGITQRFIVLCYLEYPAFERWVAEEQQRERLDIVRRPWDLRWLARHQHMLFPSCARGSMRWFAGVQHAGQDEYQFHRGLDLLILGRRAQDGNQTGGPDGIRRTAKGTVRYSPIRAWSQAHVLALCHYYRKRMPPFYSWPRGFIVGTGPWAKRKALAHDICWHEIDHIDTSIAAEAAAAGVASAVDWCRRRPSL